MVLQPPPSADDLPEAPAGRDALEILIPTVDAGGYAALAKRFAAQTQAHQLRTVVARLAQAQPDRFWGIALTQHNTWEVIVQPLHGAARMRTFDAWLLAHPMEARAHLTGFLSVRGFGAEGFRDALLIIEDGFPMPEETAAR